MIKNKTSLLKNKNYLQKIDYNFSRLGSEFDMKLSVRVTPNNMFCTLMDLKTKKILQPLFGHYLVYHSFLNHL